MIILNKVDLSVRKEEQEVCQDVAGCKRDEGKTQRPSEGQRTHLYTEHREASAGGCNPVQESRVLDGGVEGF